VASLLTATSFSSRLYYIGLLLVFSGLVVYFLFWREPSTQENLERRAFELNYAAFKNSVRLANYRFILKQAESGNNLTSIRVNGLEFNRSGFPVSGKKLTLSQNSPRNAEDCRQIWQNVLGPLQPPVSLGFMEKSYWVELSIENYCIFRSSQISDLAIEYNAVKGLVSLVAIND
jgi:hypothetical protein